MQNNVYIENLRVDSFKLNNFGWDEENTITCFNF